MELETLKDIIVSELGCEKEDITLESRLKEDLGADSLDSIELVLAIEEGAGVPIPDTAIAKIRTVKDIIDYLESVNA